MTQPSLRGSFYGAQGRHRRTAGTRDDWRTPPDVLELVRAAGPIGLDPCAHSLHPSWTGARTTWTAEDDGLRRAWGGLGLVFVNPVFGPPLRHWAAKIVTEAAQGVSIVALTPSRTDTRWFRWLVESCAVWVAYRGRPRFVADGRPSEPAPFPVVLWFFGPRPRAFARACDAAGHHVFSGPLSP